MQEPLQVQPCVIVIFGASGDLTKRKLVPALFDLYSQGKMPARFAILGVSRTKMDDASFAAHLEPHVREFADQFDTERWKTLCKRIHYTPADASRREEFAAVKSRIEQLGQEVGPTDNVLFYLSVAPQLYDPIIMNIGEQKMVLEGKRWCSLNRINPSWQRIIVEKPLGQDFESAAHLNRVLGRVFEEESIYRIDHYMGKELVQNLIVLRFANRIFEPVWNSEHIDHVQVTAAETVGVQGRGGYYDSPSGGAMRDMIQSHLLQVMTLVAMEPPVSMEAEDVRSESRKVLSATRSADWPGASSTPPPAVRAQYGPGETQGQRVTAYRAEPGVDGQSIRETFAAIKVFVDTWRWGSVPFYLRSGKRLARKTTQIVVTFKPTPQCLFRNFTQGKHCLPLNQMVIDVQPDEGIRISFQGKVPGARMNIKTVHMDFDYCQQFDASPPEAYATLLLDAIRGDQTLFKQREEVEHAWRVVQPILDRWQEQGEHGLVSYPSGSWGPRESDQLLAHDGRQWFNP